MNKRRIPYYEPEDVPAENFFREKAKEAGVPVGQWKEQNGMLSSRLQMSVVRHEIYQSTINPTTLEKILDKRAEEDWVNAAVGGPIIPSIITTGKLRFKKDLPKRKRGRPRKRWKTVAAA